MTSENTSSSSPSAGRIDSDLEREQALEEAVKRVVGAVGRLANDAVWFANSVADYLETLAPVSRNTLTEQHRGYRIESGAYTAEELDGAAEEVGRGALQLQTAETWLSHLLATMSLEDATGFLEWTEEAVRTAVSEGRLYAIEISGRLRFPAWQFSVGSEKLIPGLSEIIEIVTPRFDWQGAAAFLTTPQSSLVAMGRKTPIEWLRDGGDVNAVKQIIETNDWR